MNIGSVRLRPGSSAEAKRGVKDTLPKELQFISHELGYTWPIEVHITSTEQVKRADTTKFSGAQENLRCNRVSSTGSLIQKPPGESRTDWKMINPIIDIGHQRTWFSESACITATSAKSGGWDESPLMFLKF